MAGDEKSTKQTQQVELEECERRARLFKSQATEHANRLVKNYSKDEDAVGAVYFLRLRDAALALRGPPAMSRIQHCGRS